MHKMDALRTCFFSVQGTTAEADPHASALRLEAAAAGARGQARLLLPDGSAGALDGVRLRLDIPWPLSIVVPLVSPS